MRISITIGRLAKKKGYPQYIACIPYNLSLMAYYTDRGIRGYWYNPGKHICVLPTQSQLQKWLREEQNLHITVFPHYTNSWRFVIEEFNFKYHKNHFKVRQNTICLFTVYKTYEKALEKGLEEALKLVKP